MAARGETVWDRFGDDELVVAVMAVARSSHRQPEAIV